MPELCEISWLLDYKRLVHYKKYLTISWLVHMWQITMWTCTVSQNDTGVALCNFDADQPILIIFGR